MKTPVCDFVRKYAESRKLRLHMPGHKGKSFLGIENYDITEIDGADVLYASGGIIRESEETAAGLFGTGRTVYSAEGSSLAIRAMLYLTKLHAEAHGKKTLIAAGRNAHKTFVTAAALLDLEIEWLFGENQESIISCAVSARYLDSFLAGLADRPAAVYITSPDYLGNIADIGALSAVCRKHGVLLLVDNAHGAYLGFLSSNQHPIALGADMCCDSAHKTLPVLTGGAYLHIHRNAPAVFAEQAENAMSVFASTSPSYIILQSLDAANAYISDGYREKLSELCRNAASLKAKLANAGYTTAGTEPLKLTLAPKSFGYTGCELADILNENGIVCEFADPDYIVMMMTPELGCEDLKMLEDVLLSVKPRSAIAEKPPRICGVKKRLSLREALFAPNIELGIHSCKGRILASPTVSCPPAIPIVVCGEEIDESAVECFEYYGIDKCRVVK